MNFITYFFIQFSINFIFFSSKPFYIICLINIMKKLVPKITFVLVLTYYVKPHLFVILTVIGWFIVNIQSDLFWHRCLERQAFDTPRMYTLSPSKSIREYYFPYTGNFSKTKMYCSFLSWFFFCASSEWYSNNQNYEESRVNRAG